jgi:chromosome segregation ATPase
MSSKEAMAEEIRRLREKIRALEARDIELEKEADTADIVMISLMSEIEVVKERQQDMKKSIEESQNIQDWKADQTEELWKSAAAARQRLEYLLKRDSQYEARISQLEGEVKAFRESGQSQPAAKKMPRQPDGPPPKKAKAAAKAEAKAVSQPKTIIVKFKGATPAARRAEPSS